MIEFLGGLWHATSLLGLSASLGGIGLVVVGALGLFSLPSFLTRPFIFGGIALLVLGAVDQNGYARAARAAEIRAAEASAAAERERARKAEAITADLRAQARRDATQLAETNRRLQELTDALDTDPDRDRVCVSRDLARRLRQL